VWCARCTAELPELPSLASRLVSRDHPCDVHATCVSGLHCVGCQCAAAVQYADWLVVLPCLFTHPPISALTHPPTPHLLLGTVPAAGPPAAAPYSGQHGPLPGPGCSTPPAPALPDRSTSSSSSSGGSISHTTSLRGPPSCCWRGSSRTLAASPCPSSSGQRHELQRSSRHWSSSRWSLGNTRSTCALCIHF
jgi:hypothetical protein